MYQDMGASKVVCNAVLGEQQCLWIEIWTFGRKVSAVVFVMTFGILTNISGVEVG